MAIAREGTASGGSSFTAAPSCSLGCGTNSNRAVLAYVFTDRGSATTINSATCNGNAMAAHTALNHDSGYDGRLFYIAGDSNIATGSNTVTATMSDANTKPGIIAVAYSGVDGTTPVSGLTNAQTTTTNATWTITSATGDLVVALWSGMSLPAITGGTGTTVFFGPTLVNIAYGVMMEEAGATSTTINATWTGNREWWGTGLSLKAAAAGGGVVVNPLSGRGGAAAHPLAKIVAQSREWWRRRGDDGRPGLLVPAHLTH